MNTKLLLNWGESYGSEALAKAVAAVACVPGALKDPQNPRAAGIGAGGFVVARPRRVAELLESLQSGAKGLPELSALAERWDAVRETARRTQLRNGELRLEVSDDPSASSPWRVGACALLRFLQQRNGGSAVADGLFLGSDAPGGGRHWEYPLRIGLFNAAEVSALRRELEEALAQIPWPQLIDRTRPSSIDPGYDLVLFGGSLLDLVQVSAKPKGTQVFASLVLCTGGVGPDDDDVTEAHLRELRSRLRGAGIGAVEVAPRQLGGFLTAVVEELSHDRSVDTAIRFACERGGLSPVASTLLLSRRLVEQSRVSAFAWDLAESIDRSVPAVGERYLSLPLGDVVFGGAAAGQTDDSAGPTASAGGAARDIAQRLRSIATSGPFDSERASATEIVKAKSELGRLLGSPPFAFVGIPTVNLDALSDVFPRSVNCSLHDWRVPEIPVTTPEGNTKYLARIDIGPPRSGAAGGGVPFPDLPPVQSGGHWIDVAWIALDDEPEGRSAQYSRLYLPDRGRSTRVEFSLTTSNDGNPFRARMVFAHENRVLQSWQLVVSAATPNREPIRLVLESAPVKDFRPPEGDRPFDLSIITNHAQDGRAGLTLLSDEGIAFHRPPGLDRMADLFSGLLTAEAKAEEPPNALADDDPVELLTNLSRYGIALGKTLQGILDCELAEGTRVQVVEAVSSSWLPVEFLYHGPTLEREPKMCPRAVDALSGAGGALHSDCEFSMSRGHVCPLRLWGVRHVIERQPAEHLGATLPPDYLVRARGRGSRSLNPLQSVLLGASSKVRPADVSPTSPMVSKLSSSAASFALASDWTDWEAAVKAQRPTMMVLLPHYENLTQPVSLDALEIGRSHLAIDELDSVHVTVDPSVSPVVLLLGCETDLPGMPFLSFVQEIHRQRAAVVIGTLASIRARRAVPFAAALTEALQQAKGTDQTFGELLLGIKRAFLARGDTFVLCLTAYGDVDWHL